MKNILIKPSGKNQFKLLVHTLEAMNVIFEIVQPEHSDINKLISKSESDIISGKTSKIKTSDLWK